ncbi:DUF1080 domain-containing protein [soil metagenome]
MIAIPLPLSLPFGSAVFAFLLSSAVAAPSWIWSSKSPGGSDRATFRTSVEIPEGGVSMAMLAVTCDNGATAFLNGEKVLENPDWQEPTRRDITDLLNPGTNELTLEAKNEGGAAGLLVQLTLKQKDGKNTTIESGEGWEAMPAGASDWIPATVLAKYGAAPWGNALDGGGGGAAADTLETLPGFTGEHLYTVPKSEQGSWVAMTVDPQGRLITGDQYGGLYRVTVPAIGSEGAVGGERLATKAVGAHGLCYVFDALYFMKNEEGGAHGLYRLRDTTGDDQFDSEELLREFSGGGEHGLHSIIPSPDGQSLHLAFGNHTNIPDDLDRSRPARAWSEDHLLPRMWDANGHARGRLAPGGFILKTDPEAKEIELVSYGFRNQFDAAFDQNGELFTFDADMEWDMGSPWYRPTRVYHAVSGLDAGWRSGTGKWPIHYPDSLPPVADIGPGSPTGVAMGTGAKFPPKYQRALFVNDWTFGTMYAVHLVPSGGGFVSEFEEFVSGRPLPLTDLVIHPQDGALYFLVGGRRTQSALYRVTYTGDEPTNPAGPAAEAAEAKLRHELEALHDEGTGSGAMAKAIPHLAHPDRYVRYAARVAIERQPAEGWAHRVLAESRPWPLIEGMVALARVGAPNYQGAILDALGKVDPKSLDRDQLLGWLRAHALTFVRMGEPGDAATSVARLRPLFPSGDDETDRDLAELLIYLGDPTVVPRALQLMATAKDDHADYADDRLLDRNAGYAGAARAVHSSRPNLQQYSYLFLLRNAQAGWTPELRQTYFSWFPRAAAWKGGNSLAKFIDNIRVEALDNIAPEGERASLDSLSQNPPAAVANLRPPVGPGRAWTVEEAVGELASRRAGRDFERGRELYLATACASCHRMAGEGGGIGPDLTGAGSRYTLADLIENIVDPSKVISDQYGSETITTTAGSVVIGRAGGETDETLSLMTNPFAPESLIEIPQEDIASREPLAVSMMPPGLINTLNEDELADLVAYLISGANPEDAAFQE